MKRIGIALSFDYELFFGENRGTYSSVLFDPTKLLIDTLYECGVSATFFADTCSLQQAGKYMQSEYIDGFKDQLLYMLDKKQDVQLHIHSHWLNSKFDGEKWHFDNGSYRIHSYGFKDGKGEAEKIIADGVHCLMDIIRPSYPDYECIAFRAGGFCLQPHNELIKALFNNGIRIDSSVAPHLKSDDSAHAYDYIRKNLKTNWYMSSEGQWWENKKNDKYRLFEVPVATTNKNPVSFALRRVFKPETIKLNLEEMRGTYINSSSSNQSIKGINKIWNYISGYNAISMDAYRAEYIIDQIDRLIKGLDSHKNNNYVAVIGHPKLVTNNYIENLRRLIELIRRDSRIELICISDICNREGIRQ